jgi:Ankyrin repeats (3 copies)
MADSGVVSHEEVKRLLAKDSEVCRAIDESRITFADFAGAFERREARQTDFIVTCMHRSGGTLVPCGVLVERIHDGTIEGRDVPNLREVQPGSRVACRVEELVDWRYVDTFELVGGRVYRVFLRRQPAPVMRGIQDRQPFLVEWDKSVKMDVEFRDFLRDIANLRYAEVERKLKTNPELGRRKAQAPVRDTYTSPRAVLRITSVPRCAAEFGDAMMTELLHSLGVLTEDRGGYPPLEIAGCAGNVESVRSMLDLGFDANVVSYANRSPLHGAVDWDHEDVVALLLAHGADCNKRNNTGQAPIFSARSTNVAQRLIDAGARLDVEDDGGSTPVRYHLEHGRIEIANLLVRCGAEPEPGAPLGLDEKETMEKGAVAFRDYLRETDVRQLREWDMRTGTDFGCVLPVKDIRIQAAR